MTARDAAVLTGLGRTPSVGTPLTGRQRQVLALIALGRTNREIARELYLTVATVATQSQRVRRKLGVTNRAAAVQRGWELGLLGAAPDVLDQPDPEPTRRPT